MARKNKTGLNYFPFDVDFFSDIKIRKLLRAQSGKAVAVYACLLGIIYKNGYYIEWDDELLFIISEQTGYERAYIQEVIKSCMVLNLFSNDLFEKSKILTSKGIQIRYSEVCELLRHKSKIEEYSIINATLIPQKKRKEKNRNNPLTPLGGESDIFSFEKVWELYGKKGNRKTCERKWNALENHCRQQAIGHIPVYVESTPDKQFRKNFETYINQECWNDEIVKKNTYTQQILPFNQTHVINIKKITDDEI